MNNCSILQGMSKEILDAAVLKQFRDYLETKGKHFEDLTLEELDNEHKSYIEKEFPGSKGSPNEAVEAMTSPSPSKSVATKALVNPEEENSMCTYPMTIQKLSCKHCPDNSHVNNLFKSTSENPNNWIFNLSNGPWNKPWSDEMAKGAALECGNGMFLRFYSTWTKYYISLHFSCINILYIAVRLDWIQQGYQRPRTDQY